MRSHAPHILLAEEDGFLAELMAFRLELLGYQVQSVASGSELLVQAREQLPRGILMDSHQPDADGLDLVNRLTSDPQTKDIPILVFSIDCDLELVQKAHAAGARDFLVVPFDPTTLERKVERLLSLQPLSATSR
ncbi:MAG: response regulator [Pirellulales bacterium]|nr:response regulator [Pirellulales bacterium]